MRECWGYLGTLVQGIGVTAEIFAGALVLAAVVALMLGVALTSPKWWLRIPALTIVEAVRGTSAIVQLFWVFFVLPLMGVSIPEIPAGIFVLGMNTGAYGAEVVKGALKSIDRGQRDAAFVLSLSPLTTWWRIILPQTVPRMIPPFGNLSVELLKNTALVSLIGMSDLTFQMSVLRAQTLRDVPILLLTFALYAAMAYVVVLGFGWLERRLGRWRAGL